jgi:hypothetical protein
MSDELLPYKTEVNKHEVEIGPLLYITKLVYGDQYKSFTEKTLSYLIIIIVLVFDPLAITLLVASQKSFELVLNNPQEVRVVESKVEPEPFKSVVYNPVEDVAKDKKNNKNSQM